MQATPVNSSNLYTSNLIHKYMLLGDTHFIQSGKLRAEVSSCCILMTPVQMTEPPPPSPQMAPPLPFTFIADSSTLSGLTFIPHALQERGIRSGTIPASLAVGLGKACEIAQRDMVSDTAHIQAMADRLQRGITSQCDGVVLNGPQSTDHRYVGNLNLSFSYVEGESLIMGLKVCGFDNALLA